MAIDEAQKLHPDLILLDFSMPEVPIVMFSIHSDSFMAKEARSASLSALVSKFEYVSALVATACNLLYPTTLGPSLAGLALQMRQTCENGSSHRLPQPLPRRKTG